MTSAPLLDVQALIEARNTLPPAYRLDARLADLAKRDNILRAPLAQVVFPTVGDDPVQALHAAQALDIVTELATWHEVRTPPAQANWRETVAAINTGSPWSALQPQDDGIGSCAGSFRLHALRASLANDDAQWLMHLNAYLAAYGLAPLALNNGTAPRLFRVRTAHQTVKRMGGPRVSVIMPNFNGADHIEWAARSILDQSWTNLELIIVDDCSTDASAERIRHLCTIDPRVKAIRTPCNSGPYVAKNLALATATGDFITGHDADDWAHPQRLELQLQYLVAHGQPVNLGYMIRMMPDGKITKIGKPMDFSPDGILRKASISALFEAGFFHARIGSWDNVRYGADSEILARTAIALDHAPSFVNVLTMLCLDLETSLTNQPGSAIVNGQMPETRLSYQNSWRTWHQTLNSHRTYLPLNGGRALFDAPPTMCAPGS